MIAYRAVTIFPFEHDNNLPDIKVPDNKVPDNKTNCADSVGLMVDEGKNAPQNIEIHAEDIYFYAGSHFHFPGKNVTIMANRIFCVPNLKSPSSTTIQIDCSGSDAVKHDTSFAVGAGASGSPGYANYNRSHGFWTEMMYMNDRRGTWDSKAATNGAAGANGADGSAGGPAGNITIIGELSVTGKINCTLHLNVCGGRGAIGQRGGDGGNGGNVVVGDWDGYCSDRRDHEEDVDEMPDLTSLIGNPAAGGNGGNYGVEGQGGIVSTCLTPRNLFTTSAELQDRATAGENGTSGVVIGHDPVATKPVLGKGVPGGAQNDANCGSAKTMTDTASIRDAVHLMMIIQRLAFEYHMGYGAQPEAAVQFAATKNAVHFKESLRWLDVVVNLFNTSQDQHGKRPDVSGGQPTGRNAFIAYTQLLNKMHGLLDYYGNPLNLIPQPNIALVTVDDDINALEDVEQRQNDVADKLSNIHGQASEVHSKVQSLFQRGELDAKANADLVKQLEGQYANIRSLQTILQVKQMSLVEDLKNVERSLLNYFPKCGLQGGSGLQGVIGAVGTVAMFATPEMGAANAVGGALSVIGPGLNLNNVDPANPTANYNVIARQVYNVSEVLSSADLQTAIESASTDSMQLKEKDPKYLITINAERTKFIQLCDEYLDDRKIKGISEVKSAFDDFLKTAQEQNLAIGMYNQTAVAYSKAVTDQALADSTMAVLGQKNEQLSTAAFDLLFSYYTHAATKQKAETLRNLYNCVRAYNCASLELSQAFEVMTELESFDQINGATLKAAFTDTFAPEVVKYNLTLQDVTQHKVSASFTQESDPLLFDKFKTKRSMTWYPFLADRGRYGMQKDWYDIRMEDFRIILVGAENKVAVNDSQKQINVDVRFGSLFTVEDQVGMEHDFLIGERTTTYSYSYTDPKSSELEDYTPTSSSSLYQTSFKFTTIKGDSSNNNITPLFSPFTHWTIYVDENVVDLTELQEIKVLMDIKVRTRKSATIDSAMTEDIASDAVCERRSVKKYLLHWVGVIRSLGNVLRSCA
ncbi:hypothetical protein V1523DRAFT_419316 [Lipomyces doorenjongii]